MIIGDFRETIHYSREIIVISIAKGKEMKTFNDLIKYTITINGNRNVELKKQKVNKYTCETNVSFMSIGHDCYIHCHGPRNFFSTLNF